MTMVDYYSDVIFAVHADRKSHTGGVLTMGKGSIQIISMKQKINKKVLQKKNWYQQMISYQIFRGPRIS